MVEVGQCAMSYAMYISAALLTFKSLLHISFSTLTVVWGR